MWWSSNHCSTPICASPSAPPPSSATPIFGRAVVGATGWLVAVCALSIGSCARAEKGRTRHKSTNRRKQIRLIDTSASGPHDVATGTQKVYCAHWEEETNSARRFVLLKNIAAIHDKRLAGDVGGFPGSKKTNGGCNFFRCARASYWRESCGFLLGVRAGCGFNPSRRHTVYCDSSQCRFQSDGSHHAVHSCFCCSICARADVAH